MSAAKIEHPSVAERKARGKGLRDTCSPKSHAGWVPAQDRPDPVALLEEQNKTREQDLVPVRHGRMMVSPFTFYRGAAKIMAADLKDTPRAGLVVQLCGDAHLSNFGVFASPERTLLFDLNDFDETLPGPFEYDVKRMSASFTIAGRNNGFTKAETRAATLASVQAYREAMAGFAQMGTMDIWYARLSEKELLAEIKNLARSETGVGKKELKKGEKGAKAIAAKARTRDSLQALSKLAELVDGKYQIVSQPPIVIPMRDLPPSPGCHPTRCDTDPPAVSRLPEHPPERPAPPLGTLRGHRRRSEGRGRRERGDARLHRVAPRPGSTGPTLPSGQGGDQIGARGSPSEESVQAAGRARRRWPTDDAGRE